MALSLESVSAATTVPRTMRLVQGFACLCLGWAALNAARQSTTPALDLGHALFPGLQRHRDRDARWARRSGETRGARPALIEVVVQRDDTLDRIFRRLQISVTDLQNVRALAGVRTLLDRLNPGEHLKFLYHDGALLGLTRHVSLTQQLEVRRTDAGFAAEVIAKPIDARTTLARRSLRPC